LTKEFVKKIRVNGKSQTVKISFDYCIDSTGFDFIKEMKVYAENFEFKKYSKAEVLNAIFNFLDEEK